MIVGGVFLGLCFGEVDELLGVVAFFVVVFVLVLCVGCLGVLGIGLLFGGLVVFGLFLGGGGC
ncbi:hypothetical protein ACNQO9_19295, partial [Acinetobacter calcoaceticus]